MIAEQGCGANGGRSAATVAHLFRYPPLSTRRRRILLLLLVPIGLAIAAIIALAIWLWWPDANKVTGAAARGDLDGVRWCLRLGVDVNEPSRWGWHRENDGQTPLTAAAQHGQVEVVKFLLRNGADPNLRDFGSDYPHETPLSTAGNRQRIASAGCY